MKTYTLEIRLTMIPVNITHHNRGLLTRSSRTYFRSPELITQVNKQSAQGLTPLLLLSLLELLRQMV